MAKPFKTGDKPSSAPGNRGGKEDIKTNKPPGNAGERPGQWHVSTAMLGWPHSNENNLLGLVGEIKQKALPNLRVPPASMQ